MGVQLQLVVEVDGSELVARRVDGVEHSRWDVEAVDPFEVLARLEEPAAVARRPALWSLAALDAGLRRQGYERLGAWSAGPAGPVCQVTSALL